MQLREISIKGFRGIPDLTIPDLGRVNLVVGKNNTSKTSLLEAIFLLIGAANPNLIYNVNLFRSLTISEEDDLRFIFNKLDYKTYLQIEGWFQEKGYKRELKIKPGKKVIYAESTLSKKNGTHIFADINTATGEAIVNELILEFNNKEDRKKTQSFHGSLAYSNGNIIINHPAKYSESLRGTYVQPSIFGFGGIVEKQLENIIINKQEDKIINALKHIDPSIEDIALGASKMILVDIGINRLIPINLLGDGVIRMLNIILSISDTKNGIVLIDEIDNGLHFSTLSLLWKTVLEASKQFNVQIFATTHNYETLKYLKELLDTPDMTSFQSCVRSITLRRLPDEERNIKAYTYTYEKFNHAIEQGIEIR
ncbi:MAG: AAA family ATPase [Saprospiraceae bacterium]